MASAARKRRDVGGKNGTAKMPPRRKTQKSALRKMNNCVFILGFSAFLFILIAGSYFQALPWSLYAHGTTALDRLALSLGLQRHVYAVVIDAGSTGSRVLAFTFHKSLLDGNLKLDSELFVQVKPGLSSFADDPGAGARQMAGLLERAKDVVPAEARGATPLAMKATAGLRLLPRDKAEQLIEEVREVFRESPFHTSEGSVSIMDGTDEGLFSWFTVNFLLDRFGGGPEGTVAALDLGGGSTQVTFALGEEGEAATRAIDPESVHQVSAFHHRLPVYTHSYLGLGLMAARQAVLTAGQPANATSVRSACVNPIIHTAWEYGGTTYTVQGPEHPTFVHVAARKGVVEEDRPVVNFTQCEALVRAHVDRKVYQPRDLAHRQINAFSYYFDRATEVGLIDQFAGGVLTVHQFLEAAESSCGVPNADQPFMCLDLTFIAVLLRDGFGLAPDTKLNLFKKIDEHEISWALGAAFHILENGV